MFSALFFRGFTLFWIFIPAMVFLSFLHIAFNVWMVIDVLTRYQKDSGKIVLYILLIWFIPFGGFIYYFAAVPPEKRFFQKTLSLHKGKLTVIGVAFLVLFLLSSLSIGMLVANAKRAWDAKRTQIEEDFRKGELDQQRIRQDMEQGKQDFQKMEQDINQFNTRNDVFRANDGYTGFSCDGPVPQNILDISSEKLGITDEAAIKEICKCSSRNSPRQFQTP